MRKTTVQRKAIYGALVQSGRPLSVSEILALARNGVIGLGIATVYRNLKALQEEGLVHQVELPGEPPRWEVPASHHHHFLCQTCGKLFEIPDCPEDLMRLIPEGYLLEDHDILLRGRCDKCLGQAVPLKRWRWKA